jgi:tetratricopeptide (TPR) repeat protein
MAEETARTPSEAAVLYQKAVAAGERALGPDFFHENAGHFWGMVQTRPYMRARTDLARCLWTKGDRDAAVQHYYELLRLNPRDGQGMRGALLASLGDLGRFDEIEEILARPEYEGDDGVEWLLMKALMAFVREGASARAGELLRAGLECNKHLLDYLLGRKAESWTGGNTVRAGGEDEAAAYARNFLSVWKRVPNALAWLAISAGEADSAQVGRNAPCPCGSGKKFKKCCLNRAPEGHA